MTPRDFVDSTRLALKETADRMLASDERKDALLGESFLRTLNAKIRRYLEKEEWSKEDLLELAMLFYVMYLSSRSADE